MKQVKYSPFGSTVEAVMYPFLLLVLLWSLFLLEQYYPDFFIHLGILPKTLKGLKGILFSPLIHSPSDVMHLVNNSLPAAILLGALVYFYRSVAAQVFVISWVFCGLFVWLFAVNNGSYHIGFSGIIYSFAGFLFTSGALRKVRNLQGVSLFVVFIYGSMIWGIFPIQERVSWEGHLSGLFVGVVLAFIYRKRGVQNPKYQYEIEKEMGIEPPDLEGIWRENVRVAKEEEERLKEAFFERQSSHNLDILFGETPTVHYEYKKKKDTNPPQDDKREQ